MNVQNIHIIGQTPLVDISKWCIISSYVHTYLVKLPNGAADAIKALEENEPLACEDAIRYDMPLHPVPTREGVKMSMSNIVSPYGAMGGAVKLHCIVTECIPFEEESDKERYKRFIQDALHARRMEQSIGEKNA